MIHQIEISYAGKSPVDSFRATLISTGEVLADKVRNPEVIAAKVLAARGMTGTMETRWKGSQTVSMRWPIRELLDIAA